MSKPIHVRRHLSTLLDHLASVPASENLFKATSWPTFIAGLETRDQDVLKWSLRRLRDICQRLPWAYVRRAVQVLEKVKLARVPYETAHSGQLDWIEDLKLVVTQYPIVL